MSTDRNRAARDVSRWVVPAVCVLAAAAFAGIFLANGDTGGAISAAGIMLGYGLVLVVLSRRSEVAAILRSDGRDERRASIDLRASALALRVVVVLAVVMFCIQLAEGHTGGAWEAVCVTVGVSYLAGVALLSRRS
jgi:hypothetical protein